MSKSKRSRSGPSNVVEDYSIYLKTPNLIEKFKEYQSFEILPGRFIKFDDFALHNFSSYFENVGLMNLFSSENRRPHYPLLVQLFYINITRLTNDRNSEVLNTLVKGIEITLTPKRLGRILNIPYQGISLKDVRMSDKTLLSNDIFLPGFGPPLNHSNKLRPIPRFIARILAYNMYPKTGSFHFISSELAKALYAIMARIQVNWAELFYENLLVIPRGFLPFGAFLTRIFEAFHIDLESENSMIRSIEFFDSNALTRMKLTNFELPEQQQHESPPPQQEHTQDIPQSSHQAPSPNQASYSRQPDPSCFSDAQYNTLSARILDLETGQRALYDQQHFILQNQEDINSKIDNLDKKFDIFSMQLHQYFQGHPPPPGSSS